MRVTGSDRSRVEMLQTRGIVITIAILTALLSACGSNESAVSSNSSAATSTTASASTTADDRRVGIELREFSITPEATDLSSGKVSFDVENVGDYRHEFLVVERKPGTSEPPTAATGAMKEDAPGIDILGWVTKTTLTPDNGGKLTLRLDPGNYVFACNLVIGEVGSNAPIESHYGRGMHTAFTVS